MPLGKNLKKDTLIPSENKEKELDSKKDKKTVSTPKPKTKRENAKAEASAKPKPKAKTKPKAKSVKPKPKTAAKKKGEPVVTKEKKVSKPPELSEEKLQDETLANSKVEDNLVEQAPLESSDEQDISKDDGNIDTDIVPAVVLPVSREHVTAPKVQAQELLRQKIGTVKYLTEEEYQEKKRLKEKFDKEINDYAGKDIQLIVFKMAEEKYAIEIDRIKEVVHTPKISRIPHAPNFIKGVSNVRGSVMVVLDLGVKFGLEDSKESKEFILVIQDEKFKAGILVDEVPLTMKISGDNIVSSAGILRNTSLDETYIKGIIKTDEDMIIFIDIVELVQEDEVSIISQSIVG